MTMTRTQRNLLTLAAVLVIAALISVTRTTAGDSHMGEGFAQKDICCTFALGQHTDSTKVLIAGYNYHLLNAFAADMKSGIDINLADAAESPLDSLAAGSADIVVLPWNAEFPADIASPVYVDSVSVWVVNDDNFLGVKEMNSWLRKYYRSPSYKKTHKRFVNAFNDPYQIADLQQTLDDLSPYDSLYRVYAKQIGWDWKMLAALSFKESKFRIDARSGKGARGLMQVMPTTAGKYGLEDILNPEENIRAGAGYLTYLSRIFERRVRGGDSEELKKFVLGAYNAGEGHIIDCINYAQSQNLYDSTWASVCHILPEMEEDNIIVSDTVKLGSFDVQQASFFVDEIQTLYETFCEICNK